MPQNVYDRLGVRRVINGGSWITVLGGSIMAPEVAKAMADAVPYYVDMLELHRKVGEIIARVCGAEAGLPVTGASAGEVLMVAACMTGADEAKAGRLPDTTGMKNEIIIQRAQRNRYDGAYLLTGARFVEIGKAHATPLWEQEGAFSDKTCCVVVTFGPFIAQPIPLKTIAEIAHKHNVPVIVDAAAETFTPTQMKSFIQDGADLVTFSGGKGIRGPQSAGLLAGRKDLIAAAELNSLNYYSPHANIGRPMKVCKEELVGLAVALELFEKMDHEAEWRAWRKQSQVIVDALHEIPGLDVRLEDGDPNRQGPQAVIYFERPWKGPPQTDVMKKLREGDPPIYIGHGGYKGELWVTPVTLQPGEERIVAARLREALIGQ
ncbi:MAG: aminotransferase class V-fold PLP-dependent enzyme [Chloroflexota bacterium]|nr:aminotransferase class V-fold PLP-dependent enzyme [Chloroflexota bacterium]